MSPQLSRNDVAALRILTKITTRLSEDREAYEARVSQFNASFNTLGVSTGLAQLVTVAVGTHSRAASSRLGLSMPEWTPYLTKAEYDTLKAWADGQDVLLHVLAEER